MTVIESIQRKAAALPEQDRAELAAHLLGTLSSTDDEVSDEEVARRLEELRSGAVKGLSKAELFQEVVRISA